jgi:hypothetical protein
MVVEVGQAVNLRFFILEVDICGDSLGIDLKGVDVALQFLLAAT